MLNVSHRQKRTAIAILCLVVFLGTLLRLQDLTTKTIAHIEMYVPGIDLPSGISSPEARLNLQATLTGLLVDEEPNPPGYYILMLGWTKVAGTGILALRLPSVLFGIASILLIFWLGTLEGDKWIGVLAAGMLAFNGHQILWSQLAKMYSMACFLGLLSTVLLLLAFKKSNWQWFFQFLYLTATLVGLSTVVYFWLLFATQVLWVLRAVAKKKVIPGLFQLQILISILASPLISLAIFQGRRESYLSSDSLPGLIHFLQFGFVFDPDPFAVSSQSLPVISEILLLVLTLGLIVVGLLAKKENLQSEDSVTAGPPWQVMPLAGLFAVLFILRFSRFTTGLDYARTQLVVVSSLVPIVIVVAYFLFRRYWNYLQASRVFSMGRAILSRISDSPSVLSAIIPAGILVGISPLIPLFASRTVMLFTPYLLIVLATGLAALIKREKRWIVLLPVLGVIFWSSTIYFKDGIFERPNDYKGLAEKWIPQIDESDLIFVQRHWVTTPIFYYLKANRYHFVGNNYSEEIRRYPDARVWVLSFPGLPMTTEMAAALNDYQKRDRLEARMIMTELYVRGASTKNEFSPERNSAFDVITSVDTWDRGSSLHHVLVDLRTPLCH